MSARRVRLSGWVNRRRDHGGLIFIDLRDHYGITQCVIEPDAAAFPTVDTGALGMGADAHRQGGGAHAGDGECRSGRPAKSRCASKKRVVQSQAQELPLPVFGDMDYPEETRLTYRFLDLRRERLHKNIMLRVEHHHARCAGA